ncbi:DUF3108 domain-containing protein [Aliidiomarina sp. Khilg15.8]
MKLILQGILVLAWSALVLPVASAQAQTEQATTTPYHAKYELSRRGTERGHATRLLEEQDNGTWRYYTESYASMLFLSDRRKNDTIFRMNEGRVEPLSFKYTRSGTGSDKAFDVEFDRVANAFRSSGENDINVEWNSALLDPNAVLHQLQLDIAGSDDNWSYQLIDEKGNQREYEFARAGTETLKLPYGSVEAVRVDRVRDTDRRETFFWFAPELNYTLVKMQQLKEGKEQAQLQLTELTFND